MPDRIPEISPGQKCVGAEKFTRFITTSGDNVSFGRAKTRIAAIFYCDTGADRLRLSMSNLAIGSMALLAALLAPLLIVVPSQSMAQSITGKSAILPKPSGWFDRLSQISFGSGEVILLALFGGAMSFALIAAFWLIRERNRTADENRRLQQSISSYKATIERNEALVNVADQRVVLWNGSADMPVVLGGLPVACGAPSSKIDFLCFGNWINITSCKAFEVALNGLRTKAESFDMELQTIGGGIIEAQGRTSGAYAFVRFIVLTGERAALAQLAAEHARLLTTFDSIQSLFNRLDMQVWLSNNDGSLEWANDAYTKAVEANDSNVTAGNGIRLFERAQRNEIQAGLANNKHFSGSLHANISGDRKVVDVVEVACESGSAGIAFDKSPDEDIRKALEQTITNHAVILNQMATAIAIFDADKNLQFYNSSFQQMWKLDSGFLDSKPSNAEILAAMREGKSLPTRPDWRGWRDGQLEIYQSGEARVESWHLPDGKTLRVTVNRQTPGGANWIFEDVTKELELKSNYNSLVHVQGETLDHLSEAVAVFSSDGKLRLSNPALEKMLRLQKSTVEPGIHISTLTKYLIGNLKSQDVWDDIVGIITGYDDERGGRLGRLYLEDGKIVEFALVPLPDGRTMLTLVDVTANVNIELALTQRNEALEDASNLKNRFLKHVSYELRTPLTTISGFGELLSMEQTGKLNVVQSEYLNHINSSSTVLKTIIDDILDLATIDAGAMELELQEFEINPVVTSVAKNLSAVLKENHLSISTDFAPAASHIIADNTRFRQIVYNLVSNAVNHSPVGGHIAVNSRFDNNNILLSVSDQGPGIADDERNIIFNPFETSSNINGRKGVGLGLSIVKSFMALHDGDVHIEFAEGHGAKFVCTFPANPGEIRQAAQ